MRSQKNQRANTLVRRFHTIFTSSIHHRCTHIAALFHFYFVFCGAKLVQTERKAKRKKVFFRLALLRCSLTWRAKSNVKVKEIVIICALQCIEIDYDKLQFVCLIGGRVFTPRQQQVAYSRLARVSCTE